MIKSRIPKVISISDFAVGVAVRQEGGQCRMRSEGVRTWS